MTGSATKAPEATGKHALEEGTAFAPRFDAAGLIVCVTSDAASGEVLMVAYMNQLALQKTLETGVAHYWSRSRRELWRKGDTSGQVQSVVEMRVDCDQDALLLKVRVGGDGNSCHTGRRSCFYRIVQMGDDGARLDFDAALPASRHDHSGVDIGSRAV